MKKRINFIDILFVLLIIFSVLAYVVQTIVLIKNKQYALWTIDTNNISTGILGRIVPYLKDIIAVCLFLVIFLKNKDARRITRIFGIIIVYGTLILICNWNLDYRYIFAGVRMYLYFFVSIMYCQTINKNENIFTVIYNVLRGLIIIEFFITFIQIIYSGQIRNFGNGGYRFCGSFGNSGGLGNFTVSASLYIMIYTCITAKRSNKINYIILGMAFLLSIAAGSRVTMLLNILVIFFYICNYSINKIKMPNISKILISILIILCAFPIIYNFIIDRIGRGELMLSGGTRIDILLSFFKLENMNQFLSLLVGNGIGFATNNAYMLGIETAILVDGTITTVLAQFGLIGVVAFFFILLKILKSICIYSNKNLSIALPYCCTIILIISGGSIFEQIAMIILLCIIYFMIKYYYNRKDTYE